MSKFVVVVVIALVGSIIGLGVYQFFPLLILHSLPLTVVHSAITVFLSFNVFFNYVAAIFKSPGHPPLELPPEGAEVTPGSFMDCVYCRHCRKPKPPSTHHCSTCRKCVVDMDHHCPFIDNCIGMDNVRHFLLFLAFAVGGCLYVACLCGATGYYYADAFRGMSREFNRRLGMLPAWGWTLETVARLLWAVESTFRSHEAAPWMGAVLYLSVASTVVFLAVGFLLQSQLSLLLSGTSYIDVLKGVEREQRLTRLQCMRRVFGSGHPVTWVLPRLSAPPGAERSGDLFKKDG
mmetsp:Transcript_52052/g.165987  ORF Transcript_52052/g.165987 Transcript_52052/m.165987 type:complete len:291 (-) Transcript_52052:104-976(-)